jgi:hypothetical protein
MAQGIFYEPYLQSIEGKVRDLGQNERDAVQKATTAEVDVAQAKGSTAARKVVIDEYKNIFQSLKQQAGGVFDALLTKSQSVWSAIGNSLKTAMLNAIKDVVTSRVAAMLMGLLYGTRVTFASGGGMAGQPVFGGGGGGILSGLGLAAAGVGSGGGAGILGGLGFGTAGGGTSGGAGLGQVAQMAGAPGGTSGFTGPVGGGGGSAYPVSGGAAAGPGGILGALKGNLSGLKSFFGFGSDTGVDLGNGMGATGSWIWQNGTMLQKLQALGKSNAALVGGSVLAMDGLLGSRRGTWTGAGEAAAGGAMIGFKYGGPLGAAIGAVAGFLAGVGEKIAGVESPENEAKRLVKQIYSLNIDTATARQIVTIAKQGYAGHVSMAVRSPEVRKLLQLYADSTGQKSNLFLNDPHGVYLSQTGGSLYQSAVYNNGTPYTYPSGLGTSGPAGTTIPTGSPFGGQVVVQVSPEETANLWATGVAAGIAGNPRQVASSAVSGGTASSARVNGAIMTLAPNMLAF